MPKAEPPVGGTYTIASGWLFEEFTDINDGDRKRAAVLLIALVAALALSALVLAPGIVFFYDVTPKIVVLLLASGAVIATGPQWIPRVHHLGAHVAGRVFLAAMALQAASLVGSTLAASDRNLSFVGSTWRRLGLVEELSLLVLTVALASFARGSPRCVIVLLRTICAAGAVGAIYGIAQYFGIDPLIPAESYQIGEGEWMIVRTPGTLGHAGYFAIFLLHGVFAGAALSRIEAGAWRAVGGITAGLGSAAIVLSGTRSAIVGLIVGASFLLIWLRPKVRWRSLLIASLLVAAAWGFYASSAGQQLRARTRWYVEDPAGGGRLLLWRDSARMGAERWLFGWGLESFSSTFPAYHSAELARVQPGRYYESAHNIFLDAWSSQGLCGVLALAGLLAAGSMSLWSSRAVDSPFGGFLAAGLLAAIIAGQFLAFTAVTKFYFYAQAALLVAVFSSGSSPDKRQYRPAWRFSLTCLAAACLPVYFAVRLAAADWRLELVRQAFRSDSPQAAIGEYQRFTALRPEGVYMDLWFSREAATAAAKATSESAQRELWHAGKAAAVDAVAASETPQNAHYNLAFFASQEGDLQTVEQSLRASIALAPSWYQPYWMLAQVFAASGELPEAVAMADRAVELTGGSNAEVNAVRQSLRDATRPSP